MLARGDTLGVFQFESSGMRDALRQVKPTEFEDLIALVALYRPGPMANIPVFARRKNGLEPSTYLRPAPRADPEARTQGVYIYQEQAMQIAKDLAGFTPAEADDLRKAISKKVHALMASLREKFLAGCQANGVAHDVAESLWEENERSADYSFNKAHAACYAMIAYRTAYLKANHPEPYMAALISSVMQTKDKVPFYVNACGEMGIEVLPPDVNSSGEDFTVVDGRIRFGLTAVKGVGEGAVRAIVAGARRRRGPFTTLWDFCERVDAQQINKRVLESLIKCGGLDSTGATRGAMLAALEAAARRRPEVAGRRAARPGLDLRSRRASGEDEPQRHHPAVLGPELEQAELLAFEKETLGLYLTDHPLAEVRDQLRRRVDLPLRDLPNRREHETVSVGGLIASLRVTTSRSGDPMAFVRLDDGMTQVEVVVFGKVYGACREHLSRTRSSIVKGRVDRRDEGETKLRALEIAPFEAVPLTRRGAPARRRPHVAGPAFVDELGAPDPRLPRRGQVVMEVAPPRARASCASAPPTRCSPRRTSSARCACSAARPSSSEPGRCGRSRRPRPGRCHNAAVNGSVLELDLDFDAYLGAVRPAARARPARGDRARRGADREHRAGLPRAARREPRSSTSSRSPSSSCSSPRSAS